jgi:hypothetical protein
MEGAKNEGNRITDNGYLKIIYPKRCKVILCRDWKRFEKAIENCDIDEQYRSDKFLYLFSFFKTKV